jgi:hypothetical protein
MPRFVILEHSWNGVHFDVMLEDEASGTLRTWAVDRPIEPGIERPARALADHRLAYLDYEGPVSRERGTVRRVDRGRFTPRIWETGQVSVELEGQRFLGLLSLRKISGGLESRETSVSLWTLRLGKVD